MHCQMRHQLQVRGQHQATIFIKASEKKHKQELISFRNQRDAGLGVWANKVHI